jgi:excisionase family DNA binding protein
MAEAIVKREVLTVKEAGRVLGVSRNTAYKYANKGVIPTVRIGRKLVVPRARLDALLAGETPASDPLEQAA